MGVTLQTKERNYLWDNIKAFLMFTVVVGHFLETFPVNNILFEALDYWIYTFHMPAFLFISGYLAKGYCVNGKVKAQKVANLAAYYVIFQVIFYCILLIWDPGKEFSLFNPNIGLWYLMSMIAYYLMIPLFEKLPAYIALPIFIFMGLTIGCESNAGSFLAISRTFVFAPMFFMGYYCPEKLINILRNTKLRIVTGIGAAAVSIGIWAFFVTQLGRKYMPMALYYGKYNYDNNKLFGKLYESGQFTDVDGILLRMLSWIVGILMTLALIQLIPKAKNFLSYIGKNSLQIYLFHFILIIYFKKNPDFVNQFPIDTIWQGILVCLAGVAFTFLLSIPILGKPFEWIQKGVNKLYNR